MFDSCGSNRFTALENRQLE